MQGERDSAVQQLSLARSVLEAESEAIHTAATRLDAGMVRAVSLILAHSGKVVVTGLGKSGLVGQKIVATLCSTGTPAVFLHPADALHGDLGVYEPGDPTILLSKSGATAELVRLVPLLKQFDSRLIGILGNMNSKLAERMDVVLDASVAREADPCNLAPTNSAVVAMALGDALASALMSARHFSAADFARYHSGGQLGRNLLLTVCDTYHSRSEIACVSEGDSIKQVVVAMTAHPLGAACVIGSNDVLEGLITDGDLRRALQKFDDIRGLNAGQIMTRRPVAVRPEARLKDALQLMEDRPTQLSVLPVVDGVRRCLGLIRIHDIYAAG